MTMTLFDPRVDVQALQKKLPVYCQDIRLLSRGKRGVIFRSYCKGKDVAIKMAHPSSKANNAILQEAQNLKRANRLGIGPALLESNDDYVMMEFIQGRLIGEFLSDETVPSDEVRTVLARVIDQLFILDNAGINKQELTNPYKHIIVTDDFTPVLIDFERARVSLRPSNLTQFSQYLTSSAITSHLNARDILEDKETFSFLVRSYHDAGHSKKVTLKEEMKSLL
ncbi:MAG: hypothetical protein ACLFTH_00355 [Candidatus Woesearchaeota archaeon]